MRLCDVCGKRVNYKNFARHSRLHAEGATDDGDYDPREEAQQALAEETLAKRPPFSPPVSEFVEWLCSAAGGKRNNKEAVQCGLVATKFLNFSQSLRPRPGTHKQFAKEDLLSVEPQVYSRWMDSRSLKGYTCSTRSSYLNRMKRCGHFLSCPLFCVQSSGGPAAAWR